MTAEELIAFEADIVPLHGVERKKAVRQLRAMERRIERERERQSPEFKVAQEARRKEVEKAALERRKLRRKTDPEFRERVNAQYRACYQKTIKPRQDADPEHRARMREYHRKLRENPEHRKKMYDWQWIWRGRNRISHLVKHVIRRCRKSGMPCDVEYMMGFCDLKPTHCPCCGAELNYGRQDKGHHGPRPNGPSFDRIDTLRGYVVGNVAIICWRCNAIKRDATLSELVQIVAYMKKVLVE